MRKCDSLYSLSLSLSLLFLFWCGSVFAHPFSSLSLLSSPFRLFCTQKSRFMLSPSIIKTIFPKNRQKAFAPKKLFTTFYFGGGKRVWGSQICLIKTLRATVPSWVAPLARIIIGFITTPRLPGKRRRHMFSFYEIIYGRDFFSPPFDLLEFFGKTPINRSIQQKKRKNKGSGRGGRNPKYPLLLLSGRKWQDLTAANNICPFQF